LGRVEGAAENAISRTFDHFLKRHSDEGVFWNGLFAEKIRIFDETGHTDWDAPSSRGYYELLLRDFKRLVGTPASALEMGCGTAVLSMLLAVQGSDVTIVDKTATALCYAKIIEGRLREEFTFLGSVSYVHSDLLELERSLRGEVVHNCGVIEEMSAYDAVKVVAAMARHARRHVVVGVPNFFNPYLLGIWRRGGKGTERYYSKRTLARVLHAAGLHCVSVHNSSCIHPLIPQHVNCGLGLGFLHIGVADV